MNTLEALEAASARLAEVSAAPPYRSASIAKLATALAKAQGQIRGAAKDKTNPHFKSAYADLASVWEACRVPLTANELAVIQLPSADGNKVTVETVLAHSSGEWISDVLTMTAQQNTPQAIGSAITYARRYALSAIAGIAPEDDDGNAASGRDHKVVATPQPDVKHAALPAGAARIAAVEATGAKPWRANVEWDDYAPQQVAIFSEMVRDLAVECAQDGSPVQVQINRQGQLTKLRRWVPPTEAPKEPALTADSIPF